MINMILRKGGVGVWGVESWCVSLVFWIPACGPVDLVAEMVLCYVSRWPSTSIHAEIVEPRRFYEVGFFNSSHAQIKSTSPCAGMTVGEGF